MSAYYNENDPLAAAWLRELIKAKLIADGEVDDRSIEEVEPDDLRGFTQCHFFAGIGVWSYALRLAGWPDDRPVWTGSCPCPSFSSAGKGEGFEDARHLWPHWFRLVRKRKPATIFGEQVESAIGFGWLDLVQTDLEAETYSVGKVVLGACSVGAPHRRQRLFFVADSESRYGRCKQPTRSTERGRARLAGDRDDGRLYGDDAPCGCWDRDAWHRKYGMRPGEVCSNALSGSESLYSERRSLNEHGENGCDGQDKRWSEALSEPRTCRQVFERPDANGGNASTERLQRSREHGLRAENGRCFGFERDDQCAEIGDSINSEQSRLERLTGNVREWRGPGWLDPVAARSASEAGATRGFWSDCDWWYGKDGKYRPVGPGLFPLVTGAPARMVRLRGYGNAINAEVAQAFIEAYIEVASRIAA